MQEIGNVCKFSVNQTGDGYWNGKTTSNIRFLFFLNANSDSGT